MRLSTTENVGGNVGSFYPADGSDGHSKAYFETRDRELLEGISRVKDLDYDKGGSLGENSA